MEGLGFRVYSLDLRLGVQGPWVVHNRGRVLELMTRKSFCPSTDGSDGDAADDGHGGW